MEEKKDRTAVAIAYDPDDAAPRILAAGKGQVADRIIESAKETKRILRANRYLLPKTSTKPL